jgi:HEAT repeat protein
MEPINLLDKLNSDDEPTVISTLRKLAKSGEKSVTPPLIELLRQTNSHKIRDETALALSDLRDERAIKPLAEMIQSPVTEGHRGTLVYALSAFNCIEILPLLVDLVISGGFEVSREAFLVIEGIEGEISEDTWFKCKEKIAKNIADASDEKAELLQELYEFFTDE